LPRSAAAATIPISGAGPVGSFVGTLEYDASALKLLIELTNTSPLSNGGYITAFAFNNPGDAIEDVSLSSTDADFGLIGGSDFNDDVKVSPFGDADIGASVTNQWLGGGSPNNGIAVGQTARFVFSFAGSNLAQLTTKDFISELTTGGGGGAEWMLVRFRGFKNGGSDKVPTNDIPEPGTLVLLGTGLAAIVARRHGRRS
jgi:hypothetical protein